MFVLRRKTDGHCIPAWGRRRGRTNAEPADPKVKPPRLFTKQHQAESALKWWLEGAWWQKVIDFEYGDVELRVVPMPERRAEDWEVVEVMLSAVFHCAGRRLAGREL